MVCTTLPDFICTSHGTDRSKLLIKMNKKLTSPAVEICIECIFNILVKKQRKK